MLYLKQKPICDLVYSAYPLIKSNLILGQWCKERKIPLVIDVQDIWPEAFASVIPCTKNRFNDLLYFLTK